ncbi:mitochondrial carrier domain-containing protein [Xylariales sp. PMI_506]|nr:mitochondrial carrier domain-containing protein [Xylariales sp. PMI_506]
MALPSSSSIPSNKLLPALHHALSGSAGTLISTCATYPLSLVVTRLQVQRQLARSGHLAAADEYAGIVDAFSRILQDGEASAGGAAWRNIGALYTGLASDAAKSVLDSFLFFLFYEWFRSKRLHASTRRRFRLGVFEELAVGVAAGACSRALTTPIANVVTRKQTATLVESDQEAKELSVREIAQNIARERGVTGLWSGYSASLVLTLNPSITFFLQDFLKNRFLSQGDGWDDPAPHTTFFLAAISKAIASAITYPFQTAKARLQAGVPVEAAEDSDGESHAQAGRNIEREVDAKLKAVRAIRKLANQSIFGTIGHIVRNEGVGSLYDGVHGELLKGFFSHGTTMLAKGVVHKLLFKLYLLAAGILQELQQRRQKRGNAHLDGRDIPRALRFRRPITDYSDAENFASRQPGTPSLLSRVSSSTKKMITRRKLDNRATPSIILNLNDRTHRAYEDK